MANGNGYSWILKLLAFLLALVLAAIGAPIWIEARIASQVQYEAGERKAADVAIEHRQEQRMKRIEKKLDGIEQYIREQ
jgi:predicted lysophospholipase L1 biosynthesis ABC-type transport system permease subunit